MGADQVLEQVRDRYAQAALAVTAHGGAAGGGATTEGGCCGPQTGGPQTGGPQAEAFAGNGDEFGAARYAGEDLGGLPEEALLASLGCGNPLAVADLEPGERVLDLGSGGGIDVLLSARRVGPEGRAFGLDMTDEMLDLARQNAARAGATNVEFLKGRIEAIPLPAGSIDVVISNCVINLSVDKPAVLAEMFRVLTPGGRIGISDVVAEDDVTPEQRAERGSYVGCIAGALSRSEYLDGLAAAGFTGATVEFTHEAAPGLHGAIIRATKPVQPRTSPDTGTTSPDTGTTSPDTGTTSPDTGTTSPETGTTSPETGTTSNVSAAGPAAQAPSCCSPAEQTTCCTSDAKAGCCGGDHPEGSCGCR